MQKAMGLPYGENSTAEQNKYSSYIIQHPMIQAHFRVIQSSTKHENLTSFPGPEITSQYETKPPLLPEELLDLELLLRLRLYFELTLLAGAASGDLDLEGSRLLDLDLDLLLLAGGLLPR